MRQFSRQVVVFVALVFQVGCGASLLEPGDIPAGAYVLQSLGGFPLPAVLEGQWVREVFADTLFVSESSPQSPDSRRITRRSAVRGASEYEFNSEASFWLEVRAGDLELRAVCIGPAMNCAPIGAPVDVLPDQLVLEGTILGFGANRLVYRLAR